MAADLDRLGALDLRELPAKARGQALTELAALRSRLDAQVLAAVKAFDAAGDAGLDGAASTAAWMRHRLRLAPGTARRQVRTARRIGQLPAMAAALTAGEVSLAHVDVVTAAMDHTPTRAATIADADPIFTTAAKECDPVQLGRVVRRWAHTVDPLGELESEREQHHQRRLSVSRTFAGAVAIEGMLPPETGALVLSAIEAMSTEDYRAGRSNDEHLDPGALTTPAQRRADALVELCRRYLDSGAAPEVMGVRPHLSVTVTQASLVADQRSLGIEPAELEGVGPVSTEAARRISCDASVTGFALGVTGAPSAYGRTQRTCPPSLRRYLNLRDAGCRFPGCDRPVPWCQAHHLIHWSRGGRTDSDNLVLVCTAHHHALHEGGFTTTGNPQTGTLVFHRPDGTVLPDRKPPATPGDQPRSAIPDDQPLGREPTPPGAPRGPDKPGAG